MSWKNEYLEALQEQEMKSQNIYEFIEACKASWQAPSQYIDYWHVHLDTRLIDKTTALEAEKAASFGTTNLKDVAVTDMTANLTTPITSPSNQLTLPAQRKLQSILAETLRQKGQLESKLKLVERELFEANLQITNAFETIRDLSVEKTGLNIRLKDKIEELKGKAKLMEVNHP